MITEDYVSFEIAKLLKDKGFEQIGCQKQYNTQGDLCIGYCYGPVAPTLQMVMKWLREVHHIFIDIDYDPHEFGDKPYFTLITNMDTCSYYSGKHLPVNRATYEEMAEAAIKYCLENLI